MLQPNCHNCAFDWTNQSEKEYQKPSGHCAIYKLNPGIEHCRQMLPTQKIATFRFEPEVSDETDEQIANNRKRYESDPALRLMADTIHHQRMLKGPACDQCVCVAIYIMDSNKHKQ